MIQKRAELYFPKRLVEKPFVCRVIREFAVEVNILQAFITPEEDGRMLALIRGDAAAVESALGFLAEQEVEVTESPKRVLWRHESCVHCGACVGQCPTGSFAINEETTEVRFEVESCTGCELCLPACSYRAIDSVFEKTELPRGVP